MKRFWKWLFGHRPRFCPDCNKITYHHHDTMVEWVCDDCGSNIVMREMLEGLKHKQ
jgi:predicted RNA-binding Zn-ribbon protein involved in translation (DUF1610 family)